MFDITGTVELGKICPGTGTWNRLQDGIVGESIAAGCSRMSLYYTGFLSFVHMC